MNVLAEARITVVGLGLMGGSLAGALRGQCTNVTGVDIHANTIEIAHRRGLIDTGTTELASGVQDANIVILAAPVRAIMGLLTKLRPLLSPGCVVMDLGSTKTQIVAQMGKLPPSVHPLGGHPMCGKETSGIEAADVDLYQDAPFVLTPLPRTSDTALLQGMAVVEALGARPLLLDPVRHDRLVAAISHLPYLLACGLVGTVDTVAANDASVWEVASSGFRDTSRLAASDVTMMLDILLTNRDAVLEMLRTFEAALEDLATLLRSENEDELRSTLVAVRDHRKEKFP